MTKGFTESDAALLDELGVEEVPVKVLQHTPREERIMAGFEEIQHFVERHQRAPHRGEAGRDIFERLYVTRLDRIRQDEECLGLLAPLDYQGLLNPEADLQPEGSDEMDDDALLAELGVPAAPTDITHLRHVRSGVEKRAAEEIASRTTCEGFEQFRPGFEQVQRELKGGKRKTLRFEGASAIKPGRFFVLGGQVAFVAESGPEFKQEYGDKDARLRVIFDNGTESNLLRRSLQRALTQDPAGRRISEPSPAPLFADHADAGDRESGTIYILRSNSSDHFIAENRDLVHKIGVTSGSVQRRLARARLQPTYLMADVEVVAEFKLYNINCGKLEHLLHVVFSPARLDIEIKDRFGNPVIPQEWFLVPLHVISEAVDKVKEGTIGQFRYDPHRASLVKSRTALTDCG